MSHTGYNSLDRLLHRMALGLPSLAEMTFDLEPKPSGADLERLSAQQHIFVCGLARSGSTAFMRALHDSQSFRSLTYRDMPFVLAPGRWRNFSGRWQKDNETGERVHGDGMEVGFDSPEALEEVFWRIFAGDQYIEKHQLVPHTGYPELIEKFRAYVGAILGSADRPDLRYLSKNNNSILRLPVLQQAFPASLVLVPFREPLTHAASLLEQHKRFTAMQVEDKFTRSYMDWLVHCEFGLGHKPFVFKGQQESSASPDRLDYWLDQWLNVYTFLESSMGASVVPVCYEELCSGSVAWDSLARQAGLPAGYQLRQAFALSARQVTADYDMSRLERAKVLYDRLRLLSARQLAGS